MSHGDGLCCYSLLGQVHVSTEVDAVGDDGVSEVVLGLEVCGLGGEEVGDGTHACAVVDTRKAVVLTGNIQGMAVLGDKETGLHHLVVRLLCTEVEEFVGVLLLQACLLEGDIVLTNLMTDLPPISKRHGNRDEDSAVARLAAQAIAKEISLHIAVAIVRTYCDLRQGIGNGHAAGEFGCTDLKGKERGFQDLPYPLLRRRGILSTICTDGF